MPSLNPIIFTPLGVILAHFLFFLPSSFDRSHKWTRILGGFHAGVPFNISLEVLIVLHWSHRLLGNKQHKVVAQNCLLFMSVLVLLMKQESRISDIISACITAGEGGQRDAMWKREVVREAIWRAETGEGISCCLNTAAHLLVVCS